MARKLRAPKIENRTDRLALAVRRKPYAWVAIATGMRLGYRRNKRGAGSWVLACANGKGGEWTDRVGAADDYETADNEFTFSFHQAAERGRQMARGQVGDKSRPATLASAIDDYEADLRARDGDARNAMRVRHHLTPTLLAKPIGILTASELAAWRRALPGKPATATRTAKALRAALNRAADLDPKRLADRSAWRVGLSGLVDVYAAKHTPLPDSTVRALVAASTAIDPAFGLYVELHAVTGARPSQIAQLMVVDLQDAHARLMMPSSKKGRGQRQIKRVPVPIPPELAARLRAAAGDRAATDPLLLRSDGRPWNPAHGDHAKLFARAVAAVGIPRETLYSLRHSAAVRMLVAGTPARVVAATLDTSVGQLEKTYSVHILDHSDMVARRGLLDLSEPPAAENVVSLPRGR